jgi:hypothetical protein
LEQDELERLVERPLRLKLEDIASHPRLPEARKVYFDHFLNVYDGDPFLVRLIIESGRFLVFLLAGVLEATHDPERRETWATVKSLKEQIALFGFASDRHIDQLVKRLCAVGFLQLQPAKQDGRVRILSTTEKLRAHHREWLAAHYAPLATLYPDHDYGPAMRLDPRFCALHLSIGLQFLPSSARLMATMPDVMLFFNHAGGSMVMTALLRAAMEAGDPHTALAYAEVGDRFGISRTHVRRMLVEAQDAGLVKLHGRGGHQVEILPRFWSSHDRGLAIGMYLHDASYLAAMKLYEKSGARLLQRA